MLKNMSKLSSMACSGVDFVKNGKKILGAGLNYKAAITAETPKPENPIIFSKPTTSYIQEGQDIVIPPGFTVNEEVELGVVIGKKGYKIPKSCAMDYVGGYCLALDLTATSELSVARKKGLPWCIGKGFDTACPVSRFITKQEIPDPSNVKLWLKINGELKQESCTSDLIFDVSDLISYVSQYFTLEPNDLILTGTPPGMSVIRPGDKIEAGFPDVIDIKFNVQC